jgi:hypothetical protein
MNIQEVLKGISGTAKIQPMGINWTWVTGFASREDAQKFIDWLDEHGYEHRGIYQDRLKEGNFNVRFR